MPLDRRGHVSLSAAFEWLGQHGIASVLVEGGAEVARAVIEDKLADKLFFIFTPHVSADYKTPCVITPHLARQLLTAGWESVSSDLWVKLVK